MPDSERPWDTKKPKPPSESQPAREQQRGDASFWRRFALVIPVVALVGWCSVETKKNMDETAVNGDEIGARAACQTFVEKRLKSPGTADFSSETATQDSGPNWTVTGIVDSENSFGGTVRNGYRCELVSTGDENWRAVSVETDGN